MRSRFHILYLYMKIVFVMDYLPVVRDTIFLPMTWKQRIRSGSYGKSNSRFAYLPILDKIREISFFCRQSMFYTQNDAEREGKNVIDFFGTVSP